MPFASLLETLMKVPLSRKSVKRPLTEAQGVCLCKGKSLWLTPEVIAQQVEKGWDTFTTFVPPRIGIAYASESGGWYLYHALRNLWITPIHFREYHESLIKEWKTCEMLFFAVSPLQAEDLLLSHKEEVLFWNIPSNLASPWGAVYKNQQLLFLLPCDLSSLIMLYHALLHPFLTGWMGQSIHAWIPVRVPLPEGIKEGSEQTLFFPLKRESERFIFSSFPTHGFFVISPQEEMGKAYLSPSSLQGISFSSMFWSSFKGKELSALQKE